MDDHDVAQAGEARVLATARFPEHFEWHNYVDAWNAAPFDRFYVNSIVMAIAISIGQVITSAMAAYAFDRLGRSRT